MHMHTFTQKSFNYEEVIHYIILHQLRFSTITIPISNKSRKHHKSPLERSGFKFSAYVSITYIDILISALIY